MPSQDIRSGEFPMPIFLLDSPMPKFWLNSTTPAFWFDSWDCKDALTISPSSGKSSTITSENWCPLVEEASSIGPLVHIAYNIASPSHRFLEERQDFMGCTNGNHESLADRFNAAMSWDQKWSPLDYLTIFKADQSLTWQMNWVSLGCIPLDILW